MFSTPSAPANAGPTQPWPADQVEHWPIERLFPYRRNPRLIAGGPRENRPYRQPGRTPRYGRMRSSNRFIAPVVRARGAARRSSFATEG
jgi:hypothetical protein